MQTPKHTQLIPTRTTPALIIAVTLLLTPLAQADNINCQALLDEVSSWQPSDPIYKLTLMKAMAPNVKSTLADAGSHRKVPKGTIKQIEQTQLGYFVRECRDNPALYSHIASQRALKKTREITKEYLEYRQQ